MGNTPPVVLDHTSGEQPKQPLVTVAIMAKYLHLHPKQLFKMHRVMTNSTSTNSRAILHGAMMAANVQMEPDQQVLGLLFTMWQDDSTHKVPVSSFVTSLVPLACPDASLQDILELAFEMHHQQDEPETYTMVTDNDLADILKSICKTASFFGDDVLSPREIDDVVDDVFDAANVSDGIWGSAPASSDVTLSHKECIRRLLRNSLIQQAALNQLQLDDLPLSSPVARSNNVTKIQPVVEPKKKNSSSATTKNHRVSWSPMPATTYYDHNNHDGGGFGTFDSVIDEEEEEDDDDDEGDASTFNDEDSAISAYIFRGFQSLTQHFVSTRLLEDDSDMSTDISSIMLTPLVEIPVS
jgi:hypothetical protein